MSPTRWLACLMIIIGLVDAQWNVETSTETSVHTKETPADSGSGFKLGWDQSVRVFGVLRCRDQSASDVMVRLFDHDRFDPDDLLGEQKTNVDGRFELVGATDSVFTIVPEIYMQYKCGSDEPKCFRLPVPQSVVTWHAQPSNAYDVGILQLAGLNSNAECDTTSFSIGGGGGGGNGGDSSLFSTARHQLNETFGIQWPSFS